jgi:hypothetical protein
MSWGNKVQSSGEQGVATTYLKKKKKKKKRLLFNF